MGFEAPPHAKGAPECCWRQMHLVHFGLGAFAVSKSASCSCRRGNEAANERQAAPTSRHARASAWQAYCPLPFAHELSSTSKRHGALYRLRRIMHVARNFLPRSRCRRTNVAPSLHPYAAQHANHLPGPKGSYLYVYFIVRLAHDHLCSLGK